MTCQCCDGGSFGVQWEAATAEQTPAAGPGSDIRYNIAARATIHTLLTFTSKVQPCELSIEATKSYVLYGSCVLHMLKDAQLHK